MDSFNGPSLNAGALKCGKSLCAGPDTWGGKRKMEIINMKVTPPSFAGFQDGGRQTQAKKFR